jgi:hypothetical protein
LANTSALGCDGFAEKDAVDTGHEPLESSAPILKAALANVPLVETEKVEGRQRRALAATPSQERLEVAHAVGTEHHRLAVERISSAGRPRIASATSGLLRQRVT